MNQIKIGEFIKSLRKSKGLSQQEVADALLVTQKTVSRWENGEGVPDIAIIKDVANFFDITVDELLDGERKTKEQSSSTIKRKENDRTKLVSNKIINSLNVYLMSSLGIFGLLILIGLIILFTAHNGYATLVLSFLGTIGGFIVYFIGYKDNKNKLKDEDLDFINIEVVNKEIRQKNLMFSDLYFSLFIVTLVIVFSCFRINPYCLIIYVINFLCFIAILITGYILSRSFIKEGKTNKIKLKKDLNIIFTISMISIILFFIGNFVTYYSTTTIVYDNELVPTLLLFFYEGAYKYTFRIIGSLIMLLSIILLVIFTKKNKFITNFIISIIGFVGSLIMTLDFDFYPTLGSNLVSNIVSIGILNLLIAIVVAVYQFIIIFKEKKEVKTHE